MKQPSSRSDVSVSSPDFFFDIRKLHCLFGLAACAFVGTTVLVLVVDHNRPWKRYQLEYREHLVPLLQEIERFDREWATEAALREQQLAFQPPRPKPWWVRWIFGLPFLEPFVRRVEVEELRLEGLPLEMPFGPVPRVDRCITCHQGMSPRNLHLFPSVDLLPERMVRILLSGLDPASRGDENTFLPNGPLSNRADAPWQLSQIGDAVRILAHEVGLLLADVTFLGKRAIIIADVRPGTRGAEAGFSPGDRIVAINTSRPASAGQAAQMLLASIAKTGGAEVYLRRGLPHPYAAHPYPELVVAPQSPHPAQQFGCTVCHGGQGAAADWASAGHRANSTSPVSNSHIVSDRHLEGANRPSRSHTRWTLTMHPKELIEATCNRCHHRPELLAPHLWEGSGVGHRWLEGYHTVLKLGCFGCHEIKGTDAFGRSIGPEFRRELAWHELAEAILENVKLPPVGVPTIASLRQSPWKESARWELRGVAEDLLAEGIPPATQAVRELLSRIKILSPAEQDSPVPLRKVGPSLRLAWWKLSPTWMASFIWDPQSYSRHSRMPRFFGLYEHLPESDHARTYRLEWAEIHSIVFYLTQKRQTATLSLNTAAEGILNPAMGRSGDPTSGRKEFRRQGCVACHAHTSFPEATSDFGPELSRLAEKLKPEMGKTWLRAWLVAPSKLSPRTTMPTMSLNTPGMAGSTRAGQSASPQQKELPLDGLAHPATGSALSVTNGEGQSVIPDLIAFLTQPGEWSSASIPQIEEDAIVELAQLYLADFTSRDNADRWAREGIPPEDVSRLGPDEEVLSFPTNSEARKRYVALKSMRRRGCAACHEVPGLETAASIGPPLTGWADKWPEMLDFGERELATAVARWIYSSARPGEDPNFSARLPLRNSLSKGGNELLKRTNRDSPEGISPEEAGNATREIYARTEPLQAEKFFADFLEGRKEGFLWLKLQRPRAFDYGRTGQKDWTHRLQMPAFTWNERELLAAMTFVLGLGNQPVPEWAQGRLEKNAVLAADGLQLVDRLGCAQCHVLDWERFVVEYAPQKLVVSVTEPTFPWLQTRIKAGVPRPKLSRRLTLTDQLWGMVERDKTWEPIEEPDAEDRPTYFVNLWSAWPIPHETTWSIWDVGGPQVIVQDPFRVMSQRIEATGSCSPLVPPPWAKAPVDHPLLPGGFPATTRDGQILRGETRRHVLLAPEAASGIAANLRKANSEDLGSTQAGLPAEPMGTSPLPGELPHILAFRSAVGGRLAGILGPEIAHERAITPTDVWNLLPPPLAMQGEKTPSAWTAEYLLQPRVIRPSVIHQMPHYHLSPTEAHAIAQFFELLSNINRQRRPTWDLGDQWSELVAKSKQFPSGEAWGGAPRPIPCEDTFSGVSPLQGLPHANPGVPPGVSPGELTEGSSQNAQLAPSGVQPRQGQKTPLLPSDRQKQRLRALEILVDQKTFCGKCHVIGDQSPSQLSTVAVGPPLDAVAGRLKGEFLRRWLAAPKRVIPYTTMPANFPPTGPPLGQEILPGPPEFQIEALADLLLHYPDFLRERISLPRMLEKPGQSARSEGL